jgi:hypothetical protein
VDEVEAKPDANVLQPLPHHWDLRVLERRIEAGAATHPDRIDEWRTYLELLGQHAEDGVVGPTFDALVWEVFEPLLGAPSR